MDDIRWETSWNDVYMGTSIRDEVEKMVMTWHHLTFGHPCPLDAEEFIESYHTAIVLWIRALDLSGVNGHPMIVKQALVNATRDGYVEMGGRALTFNDIREKALEAGVDYMIDAWLSGAPLEYVLAE